MANKKKAENKKEEVKKKVTFMEEFKEFLSEYKILGIAAGLVIGAAVTSLVQSIVGGLVTPALQLLIPSESIKTLIYEYRGVEFKIGDIVNALINFFVISLLFFSFAKFFLKKEKVGKI